MTTPRHTTPLEDNVQFWKHQAESLERDRQKLIYPLVASAPLGAAVYFLTHMIYVALAVGVGLLSAWALGIYMVTVRRAEYAFALQEAQTELRQAHSQAPPPKPTDAL